MEQSYFQLQKEGTGMTSRQTGRRIAAQTQQRRNAGSSSRYKRNEPLPAKDLRRLVQMVACGSIFVLLVAAKLLLPAKMADFNTKLASAMEQNMDVQAVFSAVGRAFSGEDGGGMKDVYQAVFYPQTEDASVKMTSQTLNFQDTAALDILRGYRPKSDVSGPEGVRDTESKDASQSASNLAYVLYSQENLPEHVSMEQAILGFDYCAPVSGILSSDFGYREHPVEGEERFHYGIDLAADPGTPVNCFADGTVTAVGESSSYGRYCIVTHQGGYSTLYAHCSRVTASSGADVKRGQKIAEVGETGIATGPHLHFELQKGGTYLNPIYYVSSL